MSGTSETQQSRRWFYGAMGFVAIIWYYVMSMIAVEIVTGAGLAWYWAHIGLFAIVPAIYILGAVLEVILRD